MYIEHSFQFYTFLDAGAVAQACYVNTTVVDSIRSREN